MTTVTITRLTPAQAEERRNEIIALVGGSEDQFRVRAEAYSLSADELAMFDELEALDYLLGR